VTATLLGKKDVCNAASVDTDMGEDRGEDVEEEQPFPTFGQAFASFQCDGT
jgi:hypothetical protein